MRYTILFCLCCLPYCMLAQTTYSQKIGEGRTAYNGGRYEEAIKHFLDAVVYKGYVGSAEQEKEMKSWTDKCYNAIRAEAAFQMAEQLALPKAYEEFIAAYPNAPQAATARQRMKEATKPPWFQAMVEEDEWARMQKMNKKDAYECYLNLYPTSPYVVEARKKIAELTPTPPYTETVNGVSFTMIPIKGGIFTMGCTDEQQDCESDEKPKHSVTLSNYALGETEVTQALWYAVMGERPSYFKDCDQCPVEQVSWEDAQRFITKLNTMTARTYRLPTEAEWEYAAREGGKAVLFGNGKNIADPVQMNFKAIAEGKKTYSVVGEYRAKTTPAKTFSPNALGLYDMAGNVYEWCADDWHGSYDKAPADGKAWIDSPRGSNRVIRGGSWKEYPQYCRVADRHNITPDYRGILVGFRLASQ